MKGLGQFRGGGTIVEYGGNRYRLIAEINFSRSVLFIRGIMMHKEYVKGAWKS